MNRAVQAGLTGVVWLATLAAWAAPDRHRDVRQILDRLKQRGTDQVRQDHQRALLLLQQSLSARKAGKLDEAVTLAGRAYRLFPESKEIRDSLQRLRFEQKHARLRKTAIAVALHHIEDALDHAADLAKDKDLRQARGFVTVARDYLDQLAAEVDVEALQERADRVWVTLVRPGATEELPPPQPTRTGQPRPSIQRALTIRLNVDWRRLPLKRALIDLAKAIRVPLTIDPILEQTGYITARRIDLRVFNGTAVMVLHQLAAKTGIDFLVRDNDIWISTKQQVARLRQQPVSVVEEADAWSPFQPPSYQLLPPPPRPWLPLPPVEQPVPEESGRDRPSYLESPAAFRAHLDDLLREELPPPKP